SFLAERQPLFIRSAFVGDRGSGSLSGTQWLFVCQREDPNSVRTPACAFMCGDFMEAVQRRAEAQTNASAPLSGRGVGIGVEAADAFGYGAAGDLDPGPERRGREKCRSEKIQLPALSVLSRDVCFGSKRSR